MNQEKNGQWGIVELMGHNVIAGFITESSNFGVAMMRVDVPKTTTYDAFTKLLGAGSIYGVTFVSEEVARNVAESKKLNPVQVYAPDLIARTEHDAILEKFREHIHKLEVRALSAGAATDDIGFEPLDELEQPENEFIE